MSGYGIRPAELADAAGVNAVYNPYIRESSATFETTEYSEQARRDWIAARFENRRHPVFVAVSLEGDIAGFAGAAAFDPRGAYETSVKTSVFIGPAHQGAGLAQSLYTALFAALERVDVHRAYALIVPPNPASIALHKAFGFRQISTLSEVGRKFGRYYDVMWFEKAL